MEIFHLTENDSGYEDMEVEEIEDWPVRAIKVIDLDEQPSDEEEFYDCLEMPTMDTQLEATINKTETKELGAQCTKEDLPSQVFMITDAAGPQSVLMTLDSGAVAPEEYYRLGVPGGRKAAQMVDAQGETIKSSGIRWLGLQAQTRNGEVIELIEQFALGQGVTHPLLSFGRLLRQGWTLSRDDDGMFLDHPQRGLQIPTRLERNSLVMDDGCESMRCSSRRRRASRR